jgi:short-subunit dehydrogenase
MKVNNKLIIVTGAGGGLGREIVLSLLSKGATVMAIDRNQSALDETFKQAIIYNKKLFTFLLDITVKEAVTELVSKILTEHGAVDGLINNAGIIQPFVKLNELNYDVIERVFNVNFFGTLYLTKALLPHLLSRQEAHIVNIASMGGFLPVPGQTIYCASKAAVKLMTEGLNAELTETHVRVSIVFPGAMNTNIMGNSGLEVDRKQEEGKSQMKILSPSDAAKMIIAGMEANRSRIFVGNDSKVMDWFYRINPGFAARLIYKKMREKLSM